MLPVITSRMEAAKQDRLDYGCESTVESGNVLDVQRTAEEQQQRNRVGLDYELECTVCGTYRTPSVLARQMRERKKWTLTFHTM